MNAIRKQEEKHTPEPWGIEQTGNGPRIVALLGPRIAHMDKLIEERLAALEIA